MTEPLKTIRMPEASWKKWEAALLDPESKQGLGALQCTETGGYCCLGLLQKVVDGDVERFSQDDESLSVPTFEWLVRNGIEFYSQSMTTRVHAPEVLLTYTPAGDSRWDDVTALNDADRLTFPQILDMMRPHVEVY